MSLSDALVLANPWTIEGDDAPAPPAAIRARYAAKLADPREWLRLARGQVSLGKLAHGIVRAAGPAPSATLLARDIAAELPNAQLEVFSEGSALWDDRKALRRLLSKFLDG